MVEAVLGTGERLVSGAATSDEWVVRGALVEPESGTSPGSEEPRRSVS